MTTEPSIAAEDTDRQLTTSMPSHKRKRDTPSGNDDADADMPSSPLNKKIKLAPRDTEEREIASQLGSDFVSLAEAGDNISGNGDTQTAPTADDQNDGNAEAHAEDVHMGDGDEDAGDAGDVHMGGGDDDNARDVAVAPSE